MTSLGCCIWWFVLGLLLGWLLNWLLSRLLRRDDGDSTRYGRSASLSAEPAPASGMQTARAPAGEPEAFAAVPRPEYAPRTIDLGAARAAGFDLRSVDDLTIVEGIGPKIDELLHQAGIDTFARLARARIDELQAILDGGGAHFRLANPGTWPQQAALAADNRWHELKRLQDELIGGIEPPGHA